MDVVTLSCRGGTLVVDGADADDTALCGGKTVGLARLASGGVAVPASVCLTTRFYRAWLQSGDVARHLAGVILDPATDDRDRLPDLLSKTRRCVEASELRPDLLMELGSAVDRLCEGWDGALIVRSSGVNEDHAASSHAGIYASIIVREPDLAAVVAAVKTCWASLWTEAAWTYRERFGRSNVTTEMAVLVQRLVPAACSGVAFSADPLTSDRSTVVIEAGRGEAAATLPVEGAPEEYLVRLDAGQPPRVHHRNGRRSESVASVACLGTLEALELARLVKVVEHVMGAPMDVEWVFDGLTFWVVQARPITTLAEPGGATGGEDTLWTRANLKEVFPELPSPLALSYLSVALNRMFSAYHEGQGFALPSGAGLVGVFRGRPYLNLTLMHNMTLARGGDPGIVGRLFGGATDTASMPPPGPPARASLHDRLRLAREMLATFFRTPRRGRRLFRAIRRQAADYSAVRLEALDDAAMRAHLHQLRQSLLQESTVRRLHEVVSAQSRAFMVLDQLLAAWIPDGADLLLKRLMTGLGTLPNARMAYQLMALGSLAASEPRARAFFAGELSEAAVRGHRATLRGTRFLAGLDAFLEEFGHRGPYESDVMSPRFSEDLTPVLRLVRLYAQAGIQQDPTQHAAERSAVRQAARDEVRRALRQGQGRLAFGVRWTVFVIACRALQGLLALRDECRHVTTYLVAHLRCVSLEIGRRAARENRLAAAEDVFFLTWQELPDVLDMPPRDWREIVRARRAARRRHAQLPAPDLLRGHEAVEASEEAEEPNGDLRGFGVSPGVVRGTVKVLRPGQEIRDLTGNIVVFPTIEPTLTPIFPLVGGVVAEMGGLLSHAAILAREYGLPAIVNVRDATRRLHDGDRIELDGATGRIRMLERCAG